MDGKTLIMENHKKMHTSFSSEKIFIYREYRDRSNVGYGTHLSFVYLICIVIFMTILIKIINRWMEKPS